MPTTKNLSYRAAVGKGLIMSSPHYMKGHETVIGVRYSDSCLMTLLSPSTWKASTTLLA